MHSNRLANILDAATYLGNVPQLSACWKSIFLASTVRLHLDLVSTGYQWYKKRTISFMLAIQKKKKEMFKETYYEGIMTRVGII